MKKRTQCKPCPVCEGTGDGWHYSFDWARHVCPDCGGSGTYRDYAARLLSGEAVFAYANRVGSMKIVIPHDS